MDRIQAVIGVWTDGPRTFYVRRSSEMEHYPSVWSLPSIQFDDDELPDPTNIRAVKGVLQRMSDERFGGVRVRWTPRPITSGWCDDNPTGKLVELFLYHFELAALPLLNPRYYTSFEFLLPEEYAERSANAQCGLCTKLWSEHAYQQGLVSDRFAPKPEHME